MQIQHDAAAFATILIMCGMSPRVANFFSDRVGSSLSDIMILSKEELGSALETFAKSGQGSSVPAANRFHLPVAV